MRSQATTVEQYLSELPPDRREARSAVRDVIGEAIRRVPAKTYIEHYESTIRTMNRRATKAAARGSAKAAAPPPGKARKPARRAESRTARTKSARSTRARTGRR